MGNLHSVRKAFQRFDYEIVDIHQPEDLTKPDALVLPGVGSFDPAMDNLQATGLIPGLKTWVDQGRPLLGICLGLQLLFEKSDEGERQGLGFLPGHIEKLPAQPGERLPHMGWAPLKVVHECPLLKWDDPEAWVYFVHSYAARPTDSETLAATTSYGNIDITAMIWKGNVGACQFHPEKSSDAGAQLLRRWLDWLDQTAQLDQTAKLLADVQAQLRLTSGRKLLSPKGLSSRPTTARVREAIMNILAPRLEGSRWLDLFSGSGVMGCEALERGAQRVVAVENDLRTADICKRNLLTVRESSESHASVQVVRRDCKSWLDQCRKREHFDLIYLDPPYEAGLHTPILDGLAAGGWATSSSLVICEHRSKRDLDAGDAWIKVDRRRYGTTGLLFLSLQTHCHHDGIDSMQPQTGL